MYRLGSTRFRFTDMDDNAGLYGPHATFSPAGKILAAADGAAVMFWDAASGAGLGSVTLGRADASGVSLSSDGKTLAVGTNVSKTLLLVNRTDGAVRRIPTPDHRISALAFSPARASLLATAGYDGSTRLWDASSGAPGRKLPDDAMVTDLSFSGDGALLATASWRSTVAKNRGGTLRVWQVTSGKQLHQISVPGGVELVALSPDGTRIAGADRLRTTIRIWSLPAGTPARTLEIPRRAGAGGVTALAFAPGGHRLAAAGKDAVWLWDPSRGTILRTLAAPGSRLRSLSFTPDGAALAASGGLPRINIWDVSSGDAWPHLRGHGQAVVALAASADGRDIASAARDRTIMAWRPDAGGQPRSAPAGAPLPSTLGAGTGGVVSFAERVEGRLVLWSASPGPRRRTARYELEVDRDATACAAVSPDGQTIALGGGASDQGWDETLRLVRAGTGKVLHSLKLGHDAAVRRITFSRGGQVLAAEIDDEVQVFSARTGKKICSVQGARGAIGPLAFFPGGEAVAIAQGALIILSDARTGKVTGKLVAGGSKTGALAISPDGKRLAAGGRDRVIRVWNVATRKLLRTLSGHRGAITALLYTSGTLLSGSADTTILAWKPEPPKRK